MTPSLAELARRFDREIVRPTARRIRDRAVARAYRLRGRIDFGFCAALSEQPPILLTAPWALENGAVTPLFEALRQWPVHLLGKVHWSVLPEASGLHALQWQRSYEERFPNHRITRLANTPEELAFFETNEVDAILCSALCFVDERIFRPIGGARKRFDAVYDARISAFKRHSLAAGIRSLALIAYEHPESHDAEYVRHVTTQLASAHWFNQAPPGRPGFRMLRAEQVNAAINQCRVGLCLSAEEGAMNAAIQYLLAGLPVVSTSSIGGRDLFFEDEYALIVPDDARAVAEGVREMIARKIPPHRIREPTLEKLAPHRRRLFDLIDRIRDEAGQESDFAREWRHRWVDKFWDDRPLQRIERRIKARASPLPIRSSFRS